MRTQSEFHVQKDFMVSTLRSQINALNKVLQYIEEGNPVNGYILENIKLVEKDLRVFRKSFFAD